MRNCERRKKKIRIFYRNGGNKFDSIDRREERKKESVMETNGIKDRGKSMIRVT